MANEGTDSGTASLVRHGKVAEFILDGTHTNKKKLNPMPPRMYPQMYDLLVEFEADDDLNVLIMRGAGEDAFSVGGDLREVGEAMQSHEAVMERYWHPHREPLSPYVIRDGIWKLEMEKPVIAAVQGYCLGAGFILVGQHADLIVCSEDSVFGVTEIAHGIGGSAGARANLARHMPFRQAMKMVLTAESITGPQALELGFVNECVPKDQVFDRARELAEQIAAMPPLVIRGEKRFLQRSYDLPYRDLMEISIPLGILTHLTADANEGVSAFLEKRKANFRGV
jgi:enoyl-CoA hydratase/carnithine racemase